jgi:hypothetical protein
MGVPTTRLRLRVSPGAARTELLAASVSVVSGHTARDKVLGLRGLGQEEAERRLEEG